MSAGDGKSVTLDEAARAEHGRLEHLFAHLADLILVLDGSARIIDANPAAGATLGYTKEELLGMCPWRFVSAASFNEFIELIPTMAHDLPFTRQYPVFKKDGAQIIMELRLTRCLYAEQDMVVLSGRDVTEQRTLEDRLRRSEKSLAEGQALTKTGSWVLDFASGETDWSLETCRIFGFPDPPPSPHYREFRARVSPADRERVDAALRASFETGVPTPLEYLYILPNGVSKNIETISQPIREADGAIRKLMGTVMDVTERRKAEEALRASELLARGQLDALTQSLNVLAKESDPERLLHHVLQMIARQFGANGIGVWELKEGTARLQLAANVDGAGLQLDAPVEAESDGLVFPHEPHPIWTEFFERGTHCVIGDVQADTVRVKIAGPADAPWYDWWSEAVVNPLTPLLRTTARQIYASGVVSTLAVPMFVAGKVVGLLSIRFNQVRAYLPGEIELARALTQQAVLAMQLRRLSEQNRQAAVTAERNRLARDIHDTLAHGLTGVIVQLEAAEDALSRGLELDLAAHLERAGELAREGLNEARRSVHALRPLALGQCNLCEAMERLMRNLTAGTAMAVAFGMEGKPRALPDEWEDNLLRVAQEVLTNALRHAHAAEFKASLVFREAEVFLEFRDDGIGFNVDARHEGFGLLGMRERIAAMHGQLQVRSAAGQGTIINVAIPYPGMARN